MTSNELVVAAHIQAVNAFDLDAIVATFADDAYVNDARREFVDKTNLPGDIILSNYVSVRDEKIVSLIVINNHEPDY